MKRNLLLCGLAATSLIAAPVEFGTLPPFSLTAIVCEAPSCPSSQVITVAPTVTFDANAVELPAFGGGDFDIDFQAGGIVEITLLRDFGPPVVQGNGLIAFFLGGIANPHMHLVSPTVGAFSIGERIDVFAEASAAGTVIVARLEDVPVIPPGSVPEPGGFVLVSGGVGALALLHRRRAR